MTPTYSLILPAACRPLSPAEADAVLGGADTATDEGSLPPCCPTSKSQQGLQLYGPHLLLHQRDAQQLHHHL